MTQNGSKQWRELIFCLSCHVKLSFTFGPPSPPKKTFLSLFLVLNHLVKWLIHQFDVSSICCFAELLLLKTCCFFNWLFINWPFHQVGILSARYFLTLRICQRGISSSWQFVSFLFPHFATLPICQLAI